VTADIYSVPITGGEPTKLAAGTGIVGGIAIDSTSVYYGESGEIDQADKFVPSSGFPLYSEVLQPDGLFLDQGAGVLYWADFGDGIHNDGTVGRVSTDGSRSTVLWASLVTPQAVTVSGDYLFWLSAGKLASSGSTSAQVTPMTGSLWRTHK
jgi:hypothetical protein